MAIQSGREKRPAKYPQGEAEAYFNAAQKMASDSDAPQELQALGKVLQRILLGSKNVDLSSLPNEWAELVKKELGGVKKTPSTNTTANTLTGTRKRMDDSYS